MKINLHYTVLFLFLVILPAVSLAQENEHKVPRDHNSPTAPPDTEGQSRDLYNLDEEDRNANRVAPLATYPAKDSLASKSLVNHNHKAKIKGDQRGSNESLRNSEKQEEEKEESDSILSFNFIYYIFQKFKLSDIVDKK